MQGSPRAIHKARGFPLQVFALPACPAQYVDFRSEENSHSLLHFPVTFFANYSPAAICESQLANSLGTGAPGPPSQLRCFGEAQTPARHLAVANERQRVSHANGAGIMGPPASKCWGVRGAEPPRLKMARPGGTAKGWSLKFSGKAA
jgi:hypothetical protein